MKKLFQIIFLIFGMALFAVGVVILTGTTANNDSLQPYASSDLHQLAAYDQSAAGSICLMFGISCFIIGLIVRWATSIKQFEHDLNTDLTSFTDLRENTND